MPFKIQCTNFVTQECVQNRLAGALANVQLAGCNFYVGPMENYTTITDALVAVNNYIAATPAPPPPFPPPFPSPTAGATIHLCNYVYDESFTLPEYVNLVGQGAILTGTVTVLGNNTLSNLIFFPNTAAPAIQDVGVVPSLLGNPVLITDCTFFGLTAGSSAIDFQNGAILTAENMTYRGGVSVPQFILSAPPGGRPEHTIQNSSLRTDDTAAVPFIDIGAEVNTLEIWWSEIRGGFRLNEPIAGTGPQLNIINSNTEMPGGTASTVQFDFASAGASGAAVSVRSSVLSSPIALSVPLVAPTSTYANTSFGVSSASIPTGWGENSNFAYQPGTPGDWLGNPISLTDAVNRIAAALANSVAAGGGIGPIP